MGGLASVASNCCSMFDFGLSMSECPSSSESDSDSLALSFQNQVSTLVPSSVLFSVLLSVLLSVLFPVLATPHVSLLLHINFELRGLLVVNFALLEMFYQGGGRISPLLALAFGNHSEMAQDEIILRYGFVVANRAFMVQNLYTFENFHAYTSRNITIM